MQFDKLNDNNFLLFATKSYENPQYAGVDEFNEDIKILSYIKRILRKYTKHREIKERLLLNHIITLSNLFGNTSTARMVFYYCDEVNYPQIKTVLEYLNILPDTLLEVDLDEIDYDHNIIEILRRI